MVFQLPLLVPRSLRALLAKRTDQSLIGDSLNFIAFSRQSVHSFNAAGILISPPVQTARLDGRMFWAEKPSRIFAQTASWNHTFCAANLSNNNVALTHVEQY